MDTELKIYIDVPIEIFKHKTTSLDLDCVQVAL